MASTAVFVTSSGTLYYTYGTIQFTLFTVSSRGHITREQQTEGVFAPVGVELLSHTALHSTRLYEAAHLRVLGTSSLFRAPLLLSIQISRFHILPQFSLSLPNAFQVLHSLKTNVEITPKIRPGPFPSTLFSSQYSHVMKPYKAVRCFVHFIVIISCLFNDDVSSSGYVSAITR